MMCFFQELISAVLRPVLSGSDSRDTGACFHSFLLITSLFSFVIINLFISPASINANGHDTSTAELKAVKTGFSPGKYFSARNLDGELLAEKVLSFDSPLELSTPDTGALHFMTVDGRTQALIQDIDRKEIIAIELDTLKIKFRKTAPEAVLPASLTGDGRVIVFAHDKDSFSVTICANIADYIDFLEEKKSGSSIFLTGFPLPASKFEYVNSRPAISARGEILIHVVPRQTLYVFDSGGSFVNSYPIPFNYLPSSSGIALPVLSDSTLEVLELPVEKQGEMKRQAEARFLSCTLEHPLDRVLLLNWNFPLALVFLYPPSFEFNENRSPLTLPETEQVMLLYLAQDKTPLQLEKPLAGFPLSLQEYSAGIAGEFLYVLVPEIHGLKREKFSLFRKRTGQIAVDRKIH